VFDQEPQIRGYVLDGRASAKACFIFVDGQRAR